MINFLWNQGCEKCENVGFFPAAGIWNVNRITKREKQKSSALC